MNDPMADEPQKEEGEEETPAVGEAGASEEGAGETPIVGGAAADSDDDTVAGDEEEKTE